MERVASGEAGGVSGRQVEFPKMHSVREFLNLVKTVDGESVTELPSCNGLDALRG
ncbi:MAG: hypothetical protein JRF57_15885 [Deltaproteobacteria bacterium]|nr:hypothetical protein [Deltaproteobacteria bacterium]